jgi:hypothetical protein
MLVRKLAGLMLVLCVANLIIACTELESEPAPAPVSIADTTPMSSWLIMVYSDADDEVLEFDMLFDINEMELIGSSDDVNIIVQVDRHEDFFDLDWHDTRRYRITQDDDPVSQALRGLIDNAAGQEAQMALIWKALEQLCAQQQMPMPGKAANLGCFEADKLNQLLDK